MSCRWKEAEEVEGNGSGENKRAEKEPDTEGRAQLTEAMQSRCGGRSWLRSNTKTQENSRGQHKSHKTQIKEDGSDRTKTSPERQIISVVNTELPSVFCG